jgi:hypothetical protein
VHLDKWIARLEKEEEEKASGRAHEKIEIE